MRKCPNGHDVSDDVKYCPQCGNPLNDGITICSKCGAEFSNKAKYCPKCGSPSNNGITICSKCGAEFSNKAKFCPKCGNPTGSSQLKESGVEVSIKQDGKPNNSENNLQNEMVSQTEVKESGTKGISWFGYGIIAIAIVGACYMFGVFDDKKTNSDNDIEDTEQIQESTFISPSNNAQDETEKTNYYTENNSVHSSSSSTSLLTSFMGADNVVGVLANHTFTSGSGPDIRFDSDGIIYIDNDAAGVVSVLRYSSKSVLLRYSGGPYGEGKIAVTIENDGRMRLTDPVDGSTWYQKR